MRRKLIVLLFIITLTVSGCLAGKDLPDARQESPRSEPALADQPDDAMQSSASEEEQENEKPNEEPLATQPSIDPEELMSTELEISYESYGADVVFLNELARLDDESFLPLTSKGSSFDIGSYKLYYRADSHPYLGPVKLDGGFAKRQYPGAD